MISHWHPLCWATQTPGTETLLKRSAVSSDLDPTQARGALWMVGASQPPWPVALRMTAPHDAKWHTVHGKFPPSTFQPAFHFALIVFAWRSGFAVKGFRSRQEMQISGRGVFFHSQNANLRQQLVWTSADQFTKRDCVESKRVWRGETKCSFCC